jgi:hypothetical protein
MDMVLKLVSLLGSYMWHVSPSIASKQWGLVHLLFSRYIRTLELSGRSWTKVVLGPLQWCRALLMVCLAYNLTISAIAFYIIVA